MIETLVVMPAGQLRELLADVVREALAEQAGRSEAEWLDTSEAAKLLKEQGRGADWRFTIIGAAGTPDQAAYVDGLKSRISQAGLEDSFHFAGHLPHARVAEALATFLARDDSEFITGAPILADGGLIAAGPGLAERMGGGALTTMSGVTKGSTGEDSEFRSPDA